MSNFDKFRRLIGQASSLRRVNVSTCSAKELRANLKSISEIENYIKESICILNIYKYFQFDDLDALEAELHNAIFEDDIVQIKKRHRLVQRNCNRADKLIEDLRQSEEELEKFRGKIQKKLMSRV